MINRKIAALAVAGVLPVLVACESGRQDDPRFSPDRPADNGQQDDPELSPDRLADAQFFRAAFVNISDKYFTQLDLDELLFDGIGSLRQLDENLTMERVGSRVTVKYGGVVLKEFSSPYDSPSVWADITASVVQLGRTQSPRLRAVDSEVIYQTVLNGVLAKTDPNSRYRSRGLTARLRNARGAASVGMTVLGQGVDRGRIVYLESGGSALRSGLRIGDLLLSIDDVPIAAFEKSEEVGLALLGPIDTPVKIKALQVGAPEPQEFVLTREFRHPVNSNYRRDGNLAIIRVSSFSQRLTSNVAAALQSARQEIGSSFSGVVLDLRTNPGGLVTEAESLVDLFLGEGRIYSIVGRNRAGNRVSSAYSGGAGEDVPLVILVNGLTTAASEIVAAALQRHGRAISVGTTTRGNGTTQTSVPMPNGAELIIASGKIIPPLSDDSFDEVGVPPILCTSDPKTGEMHLAAIREGRLPTIVMIDAAATASGSLQGPRALCPPKHSSPDVDLKIARALLANPALHQRLLHVATFHRPAEAPPAAP